MLAKARTGSGKTLAYVLPILNNYFGTATPNQTKDHLLTTLILQPTKELCVQVESVINDYSENIVKCNIFTSKVTGKQAVDKALFKCDVLITTPKALLSIEALLLDILKNVQIVVFDEADSLIAEEGRGLVFVLEDS